MVPNGIFVDEEGIIRYMKFGGFDIRHPEIRQLLSDWTEKGVLPGESTETRDNQLGQDHTNAIKLFQEGNTHYRNNEVEKALAKWKEARTLEPDNMVVRKQIWAVEHPEKFYDSADIDTAWQKEQLEAGV